MFKIIKKTVLLSAISTAVIASPIEPHQLFSNPDVADMTLYVSPGQWNTMLSEFQRNPDDSKNINLDNIVYDNQSGFTDAKLAIKGNTSRVCPEQNGSSCGPHKTSWGTFVQANMKLKFGSKELFGYDRVDLKFFKADSTKFRDIYTSKLMDQAMDDSKRGQHSLVPKEDYLHLYIAIAGDTDPGNNYGKDNKLQCRAGYHCYDFGLYNIIEAATSDAYIKSRFGSSGDKHGYLWKIGNQDAGAANLYVDKNSDDWKTKYSKPWLDGQIKSASGDNCKAGNNCDEGLLFGVVDTSNEKYKPPYAFAGKRKNFDDALHLMADFIYNLNYLDSKDLQDWIVNGDVPSEWDNPYSEEINNYKFDYKSFLASMAVDVLLGRWDGYWWNINNSAIYFDKDDKTVYFIPYDLKTDFGSLPSKDGSQKVVGVLLGTTNTHTFGKTDEQMKQLPLVSRLLSIGVFKNYYDDEVAEFSRKLDSISNSNYSDIIKGYQKICNSFTQEDGFDCSSNNVQDYLCDLDHYDDNGSTPVCKDEKYLQLNNDTSGNVQWDPNQPTGESKVIVDKPAFYGSQLFRIFTHDIFYGSSTEGNFNYIKTAAYHSR